MLWPIRWVTWALMRFVFWGRYRVTVVGKDEVLAKPGPYLILPNHPALADPPNLLAHLWPSFKMRPLLLESNFKNPLLRPFKYILRAIDMPDIIRASAEDRRRAEKAVAEVIAALRAGENVILWPSGRLSRDGTEKLGGARTAADVLAAVPGVTVVLVRTRGLWGSMFSWAMGSPRSGRASRRRSASGWRTSWSSRRGGKSPSPSKRYTDRRPEPTREAVNPWLEEWYNADTPRETPTFVPHHFLFGPRTHEFPPPPAAAEFDLTTVKAETKAVVAALYEEKPSRPLSERENDPETTFMQLGLDSLDAMELTLAVEQRFGFSGDKVPTTLGQLWALAEGLQEKAPPKPPPAGWFAPVDDEPAAIPGETVAEAFLTQAIGRRRMLIVADDLAGGSHLRTARHRRLGDGRAVPLQSMRPTSVSCCPRRWRATWRSSGCTWRASCRWC